MATIQIQIKNGRSRVSKVKYYNPLSQAILTTLSFFDIFSRPLTLNEIENYLFRTAASKVDVAVMLKRLQSKSLIQEKQGLWFLKDREKIIKTHRQRSEISEEKNKRARFYGQLLNLVPFVRSISIANSLSFNSAKKSSDIDLFIITAKDRLWLARTLAVFVCTILGIKRQKEKAKDPDKFCLSFFVSQKNMNLKTIYQEPHDPYLAYWLAGLKPISGQKAYFQFINRNLWYKKELPNHNYKAAGLPPKKGLVGFLRFLAEKLFNLFGAEIIDKWLFSWQSKGVIEGADWDEVGVGVIAKRQMLKTHAHDKRRYFREKLEERLRDNLKTI